MRTTKKILVFMGFFAADLCLAGAIVFGYYELAIVHRQKTLPPEQIIDIPKPTMENDICAGETEPASEAGTDSETVSEPETEMKTEAETEFENETESETEETTEARKNIDYLTWTEKYIDKFTEEEIREPGHYSDAHVNVTVTPVTAGEGDSTITYYVADIYVAAIEYFRAAMYNNDTSLTSYVTGKQLYESEPSDILITNGDYAGNNWQGLVIRNGQVLRNLPDVSDLCVLGYDGVMHIYEANTYHLENAVEDSVWQTWAFGPSLLREDGGAKEDIGEFTMNNSNYYGSLDYLAKEQPRTALGYYEPGHYCLVVVDGRARGYSKGMTFLEMSRMFADMGCSIAYNLDGGGSSSLTFAGEYMNHASDRTVTDFIVVDTNPPERQ